MDQNNNSNRDPDSTDASITLDPKKLSFSQAQGYEALPGQLKLGELPDSARTQIWNLLYSFLESSAKQFDGFLGIHIWGDWEYVLKSTHCNFDNLALDDWENGFEVNRQKLRRQIELDSFNHVFDRLQFMMRHKSCPLEFAVGLKLVFMDCRLAYTVELGPPPTILSAATREEGAALIESLQTLRQAGLAASASHLLNAGQNINQRDWAGGVRESIHAVESVARIIDPDASRTLAPALKSIEEQGELHPALKKAFVKIYGYTSDEQGIRHALLDGTTAKVGMDEAVFMLGACASFASYLWRKHVSGAKS